MSFILTLFSLLVIAIGGLMIYKPKLFPELVEPYFDTLGLQVWASVGRFLIGLALFVYASHSHLPALLLILGVLGMISGIVFGAMSPANFRSFLNSAVNKLEDFGIIPGVVITAVGVLLLYAVW